MVTRSYIEPLQNSDKTKTFLLDHLQWYTKVESGIQSNVILLLYYRVTLLKSEPLEQIQLYNRVTIFNSEI